MKGIFFLSHLSGLTLRQSKKNKKRGLSPSWGVRGKLQNMLEGVSISHLVWERPEIPSEELEGANGHKDLRAASLSPAAF